MGEVEEIRMEGKASTMFIVACWHKGLRDLRREKPKGIPLLRREDKRRSERGEALPGEFSTSETQVWGKYRGRCHGAQGALNCATPDRNYLRCFKDGGIERSRLRKGKTT